MSQHEMKFRLEGNGPDLSIFISGLTCLDSDAECRSEGHCIVADWVDNEAQDFRGSFSVKVPVSVEWYDDWPTIDIGNPDA